MSPPRWLWALFLATLTAPFWDLGHPLIEVDDARYAAVPRAMALSGDWVTPKLNGMDYVEKPPLWYWLCAASYKLLGVSEAAAHLPLALLALLTLLGTAWLGWWLYSPRAGLSAAVVLGTGALFFGLSHNITPDMGLTAFLLWCAALILRTLLRPEDGRWAAPAAWACSGLAFLAKGLVAFVFPSAWAAALFVLFPDLRPRFKALLSPLGLALFILIAAPWFVLMQRRHPDFLSTFFIEQHFQRFLTAKYNRRSPWYFFLLVVPAGMLPWTPALFAGLGSAWRSWKEGDARGPALALWALLVVAFFSKSQSKLASYVLPVLPQLSLLASRAVGEPRSERFIRGARALGWGLLAAAAAAPFAKAFVPEPSLPPGGALAAGAAALAALGLALALFGRGDELKRLALAGLAAGLCASLGLRAAGDLATSRGICLEIAGRLGPGDRIYTYGTYLHAIPFYTGHLVDKTVNWVGELHYAKRDPANAQRFGDDGDIRLLPAEGHKTFVVLRRFEAPYFLTLTTPAELKSWKTFGHWVLAEL